MSYPSDQIAQLRSLIQNKQYDQARRLLNKIDHPKKQQWLEELNRRQAAEQPAITNTTTQTKSVPQNPAIQNDQRGDAMLSFLRVVLGAIIVWVIVLGIMLVVDRQFTIHKYALNESNPREATVLVAFTVAGTFLFALFSRTIGDKHHLLIGLYYALCAGGLFVAWHYGSIYLMQNDTPQFAILFQPDTISYYQNFITTLTGGQALNYGVALVISLGMAFYLGATSEERLLANARKR
jgi:hypothetical protein